VEIHSLGTENCYKQRVTSVIFKDGDIKLRNYRVLCVDKDQHLSHRNFLCYMNVANKAF